MARTGRPRGFDKGDVVSQAMQVFWAYGYESASLTQLKAAMGGLSTASFYAAFGSKEGLFQEVVETYLTSHGQALASLRDATLPPREAIERAFRLSARMQTDPAHPTGCLVALSMNISSPANRHIQARLARERERNRKFLRACVERALAAGELRPETDAKALAGVFNTFLLGISLQARDGVSLASLETAVSQLMEIWDAQRISKGEPAARSSPMKLPGGRRRRLPLARKTNVPHA